MAPKYEDEDIAHRVRVDAEFESELHMYLTGDASHDLMTAVLEERMQRKARQRAVAFGLIWKRSRMSWLQWDGVVDLMSESLNQMLGVGGDLCVVPRARQLSALICLHAPDVFTTSLEKEGNFATFTAADGTVSYRRRAEALFEFDRQLRGKFYNGIIRRLNGGSSDSRDGPLIESPLVFLLDAAQYARGRQGTDGTTALYKMPIKGIVSYRTEQCLVAFTSLTKDDAKVLGPHLRAGSVAVPSVFDMLRRLKGDGIITDWFKHTLAIASLGLKGVMCMAGGSGFRSDYDNALSCCGRSVASRYTNGHGLRMYTPPDWAYDEIMRALGTCTTVKERAEVLRFFKKRSAPILPLDAADYMHGEMHSAGTGEKGVITDVGKLMLSITPKTQKQWLEHVSSRCGWPIEQNHKDEGKVTYPHGGKTGDFALLGGEKYAALLGFNPTGDDAGAFVAQALDQLAEWQAISIMPKTSEVGFAAFSSVMLAGSWLANSLIVLLFGERALRVSARVSSDCYGHVLARAKKFGWSIAAFSERPVEDFHRKMCRAFLRGMLGGGKGEKEAERLVNTITAMAAEVAVDDQLGESVRRSCIAAAEAKLVRLHRNHRKRFLCDKADLITKTRGAAHLAMLVAENSRAASVEAGVDDGGNEPPRTEQGGQTAAAEGSVDDDDDDDDEDEDDAPLGDEDEDPDVDGDENEASLRPPFTDVTIPLSRAWLKNGAQVSASETSDGCP